MSLDLNKLENKLNDALKKETKESLNEFLKEQRTHKYKILMCDDVIVQVPALHAGIYEEINIPLLFDIDSTIESIIKKYKGYFNESLKARENIKKCQLKTVELKIID